MIADGGMIKCGGRCENVKLKVGYYKLKKHMFAIDMGRFYRVLGAEWLRTLGPVTMDFKELEFSLTQDYHTYTLKGIHACPPQIISSHHMDKLLKKGHSGIIAQFHAIQILDSPTQEVHPDLQLVLNKHQRVF
jgi:hypothetical protein